MRKSSLLMATIVATVFGLLVVALPVRSSADPYPEYGSENMGRIEHEREELGEALKAQHRDWRILHQERQEMRETRREGDWREYQHERRETEQAADALRRNHARVEHERRELHEQRHALHHHHWEED